MRMRMGRGQRAGRSRGEPGPRRKVRGDPAGLPGSVRCGSVPRGPVLRHRRLRGAGAGGPGPRPCPRGVRREGGPAVVLWGGAGRGFRVHPQGAGGGLGAPGLSPEPWEGGHRASDPAPLAPQASRRKCILVDHHT